MTPSFLVRHVVLLGVFGAITGGCRSSTLATGVSDSTFVAVMAELKRAHDTPGLDSAGRDARRKAILQGRGLTPAQLESAAVQLAKNPTRAQAVWQAIQRRAIDTTSKPSPVDSAKKTQPVDTTAKTLPVDTTPKPLPADTNPKPLPADTSAKPPPDTTAKRPPADTSKPT
jgi:hypothetical protein